VRPLIARRVRAVAAVAAVSLVTVAGCTSGKPTPKASSPASAASSKAGAPKVASDAFGQRAKITIPAGNPSGKLDTTVKVQGQGTKVATGDMVVLNFTGKLWRTGDDLGSSYDVDPSTGAPKPVTMVEDQHNVLAGWEEGLMGQAAGSRVEVVVPPDKGFGAKGRPADSSFPIEIKPTDTMVFDLDIVGVYPVPTADIPSGPNVALDASLPQVQPYFAQDPKNPKDPKITVPSSKPAPTDLVVKTVIQGKGAPVKAGQTLVMQYEGVLWKDGSVFDSSWTKGKAPFATAIGVGSVVKGWDQGLVGQNVGSRVLLVIPPALGYGSAGSGPIGGTDTMVFIVDILDAG
jgi:FKBP-type peptidyl-prolyl cis-trans isomerase